MKSLIQGHISSGSRITNSSCLLFSRLHLKQNTAYFMGFLELPDSMVYDVSVSGVLQRNLEGSFFFFFLLIEERSCETI